MKNNDGSTEILHAEETIEFVYESGSRIRVPKAARVPDTMVIEAIREHIEEILPPDLNTSHEKRMWLQNNALNLLVHAFGVAPNGEAIPPDILQAMKDIDLAHDYINPNKVRGITNEERSRRYTELTGGGISVAKGKSRPSTAARDLLLAIETKHISNVRERNQAFRDGVNGKYPACENGNNISKLVKRADSMLERFSDCDQEVLYHVLQLITEEKQNVNEGDIRKFYDLYVGLMWHFGREAKIKLSHRNE